MSSTQQKDIMADFDPYHLWLQIPLADQPPTLYRLLGLVEFESDPEVIDNATEQRLIHLRNAQNGPNGKLAQKLMTEVSKARITLLDEGKKTEYDAKLTAEKNRAAAEHHQNSVAILPQAAITKSAEATRPQVSATKNTSPDTGVSNQIVTTKATSKRLAYSNRKKNSAAMMRMLLAFTVIVVGSIIYFVVTQNKNNASEDPSASDAKSANEKNIKENELAKDKKSFGGNSANKKKTKGSSDSNSKKGNQAAKGIDARALTAAELQELEFLRGEIKKVRKTLADRNPKLALSHIMHANSQVKGPNAKQMIKGLTEVRRDVAAFWRNIPSRCRRLKATQQIEFSDTVAIVVMASTEEVKIKVSGEIKSYVPNELPIGLAMKIFEITSPAKDIHYYRTRGALFFVESHHDKSRMMTAIECWSEAEAQGADVADLFALTE